jgi:hypothetical protein
MLKPSNSQKIARKKYESGKYFLPNRIIRQLSLHMRRFHDWYLRVIRTKLMIIQAIVPAGIFGSLAGTIVFDFDDIHTPHMLSPQINGNESNSHVVPVSPCPLDMI